MVKYLFTEAVRLDIPSKRSQPNTPKGHGRIETRRCWITPNVRWFEDRAQWSCLRSFAMIECERTVGEDKANIRLRNLAENV